jgi:NAD(P)-dependent dehydrogenase (short-subunit alcohol dehydrogenase family)
MEFDGKTAVVTGARRGIGRAIALDLAQNGANVAIVDVSEQDAREVCDQIGSLGRRALALRANVASATDAQQMVETAVKELGRLDFLVNNAGITKDAMFHKMTDEQWDAVVAVNLKGVYNCCKAVIEGMRQRQYGKIVSLASISAFGNFGQTNYGATKAAVIGFTKSLAKESGKYNITVNAVAPGYINTDMLKAVPDNVLQKFIDVIPAKRLGEPSEVASVVAFLSCDDSSFVNGECIVISGGSYT